MENVFNLFTKKRLFLIGMAGPNSLEDLKELIEPIKQYFDGLVWVLHDAVGSEEEKYLESVKGAGKIIPFTYCNRQDLSRNVCLYASNMKHGDWCVQVDVLERISPSFLENIRNVIEQADQADVKLMYYYNKPFVFEYHESLVYRGNPHIGLFRQDGFGKGVELSSSFPTENEVRYNVRPIKRPDPYHFVNHYCGYYLYPWGSNHCLLGIEKNGDPNILFPIRAARQQQFRNELMRLDIPLTVDSVIHTAKNLSNYPTLKRYFQLEKVLNDTFRYHVLGDREFKDNHDFKDMVEIP